MESNNTFNPAAFTKLPVSSHLKNNSAGGVIKVTTPHKGIVLLDWQSNGMFSVHEKLGSKMAYDLHILETEAREFLLNQWLAAQSNASASETSAPNK